MSDQEHSSEVGGDDVVPVFWRQLANRAAGMCDTGVVDEKVDTLEILSDGGDGFGHALLVTNIAFDCEHANLLLRELGGNLGKAGFVPAANDQVALFGGQSTSDRQPDALGGSGDEGILSF